MTSKDNWAKMWDEAEEVLGGKIEILCNNAGVPPRVKYMCQLFKTSNYQLNIITGWNGHKLGCDDNWSHDRSHIRH